MQYAIIAVIIASALAVSILSLEFSAPNVGVFALFAQMMLILIIFDRGFGVRE